jgi:UTP--glucose-1-phosphate uridylyltransferase
LRFDVTSSPKRSAGIRKAIIPAAGKGTRLLPLTKAIPKELLPVGAKPVLEHIIEEIAASGITDVLFIISEDKTAIRTHFGDSMHGLRIDYVFQEEPSGLADAIYRGKDCVGGEPFAVALGDSIVETDEAVLPFRRLLDTFEATAADAAILVEKTPREELSGFGIVRPKRQVGPSFEIDALVEKPKPEDAPSDYAIAGRYVFDPIIFDYIDRTPRGAGNEYQITDAIDLMLKDGNQVWCVALGENEHRTDIGTIDAYFDAFLREVDRY